MAKILIIDDEAGVRRSVAIALRRAGHEIQEARSGEDAMRRLCRDQYDLMICDLHMEGIDGMTVLQQSKRDCPDLEVIIMTAYGTIDSAVKAIRKGAYEYLTKPFREDELLIAVSKAIEHNKLRLRVRLLERSMREQFGIGNIITVDKRMQDIIKNALAVAATDSNVLITGESGTGKELVAGMIHNHSNVADNPFIPVNCGGLPEQLLESELFGHVKGAFTGATSNKRGLVEEADGGTIFLDEVAETSPSLQVKLLRFIQNGEMRRLGSTENREVKVRIIAATNKELQKAMRDGQFREDLFYRLNVIPLHLPPLRERRDDVPLLAQHFLEADSQRFQKPVRQFSTEVLDILVQYSWPGNVRELMNTIEHGVALCEGDVILRKHLPQRIAERLGFLSVRNGGGTATLADVEKSYILKILRDTRWNQKQACKILGLSKTTLYRRLKQYDIRPREMVVT